MPLPYAILIPKKVPEFKTCIVFCLRLYYMFQRRYVYGGTNQYTEKFGLPLSEKGSELLFVEKNNTLKAKRRVEFGQSFLQQIIYAFCERTV